EARSGHAQACQYAKALRGDCRQAAGATHGRLHGAKRPDHRICTEPDRHPDAETDHGLSRASDLRARGERAVRSRFERLTQKLLGDSACIGGARAVERVGPEPSAVGAPNHSESACDAMRCGRRSARCFGHRRVVGVAAGPFWRDRKNTRQTSSQTPRMLTVVPSQRTSARRRMHRRRVRLRRMSPDIIVTTPFDTRLPTASLFTVSPNGGAYLVETDPRFADYRQWLGSDYLLDALGYDPATMHRRLGDGYYEQRLVREQIGELTGRRFLTGYASDEEQYRALMEAGALFAQQFGLRPGVALSAEQMAQLTSDIVWLVEQTVTLADGSTQTVLVPQVYLRLRPGDLDDTGALLAGANVQLNLRGDLVNTGSIAGRQLVSINANNIHHLAGGTISGQAVGLQAAQDIHIIGASVTATDVLSVQAGGDITVASTTQTLEGGGFHQYSLTQVDRVAGLYVTNPGGLGVLSVGAGGDVTLQGAQIVNAGVDGITRIAAAGNVHLSTLVTGEQRDTTVDARNHHRTGTVTHVGSTVQGAGNVVLQAGQDMALTAAQLQAGDALLLQAGNDLPLQAATVVSEQGGVALAAGRDISLPTASEAHRLQV